MEYRKDMSGWGRISFLLGVGVALGAGCGGRTATLEGEYGTGDEGGSVGVAGTVSRGGASSVAGRPSRGGRGNVAGSVGVAGAYAMGGYGTGGAVVYPTGGTFAFGGAYPVAGYGGYVSGGAYPIGGYGGYSVGGYGGYSVGGYGGYSVGGFAGQGGLACGECLRQACAPALSQCLQDFGCISILSCMQSKGCQAFQCYSDAYCRDTIDQWGGPAGQSMSELLQTFSCAVQAGCPCN
jgi:hypothetical protein